MAQRAADQITLVDLTDGYSVYFEKDAFIFPGNTTNATASNTTVKITAMVGPDIVPCSVDPATMTKPTGITVTKDAHATTPTITISASTSFNAPGVLLIPVLVDGEITITKGIALSFAKTGAAGTSSTVVGLKNEAHMIPCGPDGKTLGASTIDVDFFGYVGSSRAAVTASVGALPSGITTGTNTAGTTSVDGVLKFSVASGSTLGGGMSGTIPITLTCNSISRALTFSWSKAQAGADGSHAIALEVTSSQGLVFKNTQVATTLTAKVYVGGTEVTGGALGALGTIKWYKDGVYQTGQDGTTLTVTAGQVTDAATFEARLEN